MENESSGSHPPRRVGCHARETIRGRCPSATAVPAWARLQQALQASQKMLEGTKLSNCPELSWAMQKEPKTIAEVMAVLPAAEGNEVRKMSLRVQIQAKFGVTARLNLGWRDTQGYHMVGIGGSVSSAVKVGGNLFAGIHESGRSARVVVGISSFTFQYTFPLPKLGKQPAELGTHVLSGTHLAGHEWADDFLIMASARSLQGLHAQARAQQWEVPGFSEALETASIVLAGERGVVSKIAKHFELTAKQLQEIWREPGSQSQRPELLLKIHADELTATSEQRLLRCSTHGLAFQRVPIDAEIAVKAPATILGVLAARFSEEDSAKLILFLGHFTFEYTFSIELTKLDLRQRVGFAFKGMLRNDAP